MHEVELFEANNDGIDGLAGSVKTAISCLWSFSSQRSFVARLSRFEPDIVHVHNFFPQISPAIHYAAYSRGIPVVQTLHNYRLICPGTYMVRDGAACEACTHEWYPASAVRSGCYRKSRMASAAVANMLVLHRAMGTWKKKVSCFIALSEFARQRFAQNGIPASRITVKPNFLTDDPGQGRGGNNFVLFVGRLSEEKGISCMLEAWRALRPKSRLVIVGDGPLSSEVKEAMNLDQSIRWLGFRSRPEILKLMGEAIALVFPSLWYEAFPLVLAEAFASGLPVIGSNLGSTAEIVSHRRTGLLFTPGSPLDLAAALQWAFTHRDEFDAMREAARCEFESKYTADANYKALMNIYETATPASASSRLAAAI